MSPINQVWELLEAFQERLAEVDFDSDVYADLASRMDALDALLTERGVFDHV